MLEIVKFILATMVRLVVSIMIVLAVRLIVERGVADSSTWVVRVVVT